MKVSKRTPRTDMYRDAIHDRMASFHQKLSEELNVPLAILDTSLVDFARLSSRVAFDNGEVDFELASAGDNDQQIAEKFIRYLDSQCIEVVDQAEQAIRAKDRPAHPHAGEGDENFTPAAISGEMTTGQNSEEKPPK